MKKLLLSSIILLLFSSSILIFQVSCQKEAKADTNNITQQNKIIYIKAILASNENEIWTANIHTPQCTDWNVIDIVLLLAQSIVPVVFDQSGHRSDQHFLGFIDNL